MSISLENDHRCIERATECDCPICGEFMFTSTATVVFMVCNIVRFAYFIDTYLQPCGHSIHHKCYYEHMKTSYRCPTCNRSIINMETQFRALDAEIELQPLPAPYDQWRSLIVCNDCSAKCNVAYHFLGLRCNNCRSYNTSQVRQIRPELDAIERNGDHVAITATGYPEQQLGRTVGVLEDLVISARIAQEQPQTLPAELTAREQVRQAWQQELATASANRAVMAAQEAIVVAMGLDHGDADLWPEESEDDEVEGEEDDDEMTGSEGTEAGEIVDSEESDGDESDDELISLFGHI